MVVIRHHSYFNNNVFLCTGEHMVKINIKEYNKKSTEIIENDSQNLFNFKNEEELKESNTITEVFDNLDRDVTGEDNMTSIDFNTRLNTFEIPAISSLQMMNTFLVGGKYCSIMARTIKRHKVSFMGLGRSEKVDIAKGEREHENDSKEKSLFGRIKGFMGGNNENYKQ